MNITFTTEHKTDELLSMQEHYKTNAKDYTKSEHDINCNINEVIFSISLEPCGSIYS